MKRIANVFTNPHFVFALSFLTSAMASVITLAAPKLTNMRDVRTQPLFHLPPS